MKLRDREITSPVVQCRAHGWSKRRSNKTPPWLASEVKRLVFRHCKPLNAASRKHECIPQLYKCLIRSANRSNVQMFKTPRHPNQCLSGWVFEVNQPKKQQSEELQHTGRCQCSPVVFGVVCVCKWKDRRLNQVPRITHNCCFLCNRHGTVWNLVQNLVKTSVTSWRLAD